MIRRIPPIETSAVKSFIRFLNNRDYYTIVMHLRRQKGISEDIIESTIATIDDEDSAYRAATSKARSLSRSDYESFRRRLGGYLQRRGFNYGVVEKTIKRVWQEGL